MEQKQDKQSLAVAEERLVLSRILNEASESQKDDKLRVHYNADLNTISVNLPAGSSGSLSAQLMAARNDKSLERRISVVLHQVGVPAHLKGYPFLRSAIRLRMYSEDKVGIITKVIYPFIAQQFHTSSSSVERAIQHAIEVAWNKGRLKAGSNFLGSAAVENKKPTNGQLITMLANFLSTEKSRGHQ